MFYQRLKDSGLKKNFREKKFAEAKCEVSRYNVPDASEIKNNKIFINIDIGQIYLKVYNKVFKVLRRHFKEKQS